MIDLTDVEPDDAGAFGSYYNLHDGTGVKTLFMYLEDAPKSERELLDAPVWQTAAAELGDLLKVESSGLTPKGLGLEVVKKGSHYYAGIRMEHLERHSPHMMVYERCVRIEKALNNRLGRVTGYIHGDLHPGNIIITGGSGRPVRIKAVDFGSGYLKPRSER